MSNERLRAALKQAGLESEDLAERVQVDEKTVRRWLSGRTPYSRHRTKVAKALARDEHELWPETATTTPAEDARREIIGAYANTSDLRAPDWRTLMQNAVEQIELLSYSLIDILATPGVTNEPDRVRRRLGLLVLIVVHRAML